MKKVLNISQMSLDIMTMTIFVGVRPASDLKLFFDALGVFAAVRLWKDPNKVLTFSHCSHPGAVGLVERAKLMAQTQEGASQRKEKYRGEQTIHSTSF